ncbi:hypothetical protein ACVXZ4_16655 [Lacisediminihabitans sp. FW035]
MIKRDVGAEDFDLQGLNPDDTEEELHPSPHRPSPHDDADDDFAEEPDYQVNDG